LLTFELPTTPVKQRLTFAGLVFSLVAQAQSSQFSNLGSWSILNANVKLNEKWAVFAEGQIRSLKFYDDFHYYEVKGGVQYNLDKNFSVAIAGGSYNTYSPGGSFEDPKLSDEERLWEQLTMKQYFQRVKFEHRYRAEQRWTQTGFRHRFRYRINAVVPLGKQRQVVAGVWYLNFSNEIFFTNQAPYFERNRFFMGVGRKMTETLTLQTGYMQQFDYRLVDEIGRNFFQISFLFDLRWKGHPAEKVPTHVD
jgi:hypothetical protein